MGVWTLLEWAGKILFVAYFVMSGVNHLVNHKAVTGYAQSKNVPAPGVAVAVTGLMMLAAAPMILFNWHLAWGAWLLVLFLVPTAFIVHDYWAEADPMTKAGQKAQFWKNITIAGAALLMAIGHRGGM